ncbi:hypothetical protein [Streptomyces sp. NBC_00893]|uniref:hypothetical protein n=1 Tax=Streptomyces sp. NBC_00893 TaxID=2975862 RepID=UPI00224EBFBA|nr:hypothetical protein [Streptomyces sp. NBC_00893]MCX4851716.1 hypothetical protein [Streptomyces sp. NBC_00893]
MVASVSPFPSFLQSEKFEHIHTAARISSRTSSSRIRFSTCRSEYDPQRTTLTERRLAKVAKVAKLKALHPDGAGQLGLGKISERTLRRWAAAWTKQGIMGLADGRLIPVLRGHRKITPQIAEAVG